MGIRARSELQHDFSRELLGKAMSAYYGGRTECGIRRVPVPVVYCDFLSMYTTVNALMGLWDQVTAARIDVQEATEEIRQLVQRIDLEECLNPEMWRQLPALVQSNRVAPCSRFVPGTTRRTGTSVRTASGQRIRCGTRSRT
jgi:hypothetical protein